MDAERRQPWSLAFGVAAIVLLAVTIANAWVVDDAFITFRTIDNFVHGFGLRWNPDERVQTYTHPLWMLICTIPYFFAREVFYTVIAVSLLCTIAALALYRRYAGAETWKPAAFVLILLSSKAFMDFTTAGLENALTHLWAVVFFMTIIPAAGGGIFTPRSCRWLSLLASLAYVTRPDTAFLFAPVVVSVGMVTFRRWGAAPVLRAVALGLLPAIAWMVFAIVYYGFPFPNTAYAKAFVTGLTFTQRTKQGIAYFLMTLLWDPATAVWIGLFAYLALVRRHTGTLLLGLGVVAYLAYVMFVGATGVHMSGRLFTLPLIVAAMGVLALARTEDAAAAVSLAVALMVFAPAAPIRTLGCSWSPSPPDGVGSSGVVDMRFRACFEGGSLAKFQRGKRLPDTPWLKDGFDLRARPQHAWYSGPGGLAIMGFFGYGAGPTKFIIDPLGVTDPLIARLPAALDPGWWPGHFRRDPPPGYLESAETQSNLLQDPALHAYYESLRLITRGPLFSWARWRELIAMNAGRRDYLVREYQQRRASPPSRD